MSKKPYQCESAECRAVHLLERTLRSIPAHVPNGLGGIEAGFHPNQLYSDIKDYLDGIKDPASEDVERCQTCHGTREEPLCPDCHGRPCTCEDMPENADRYNQCPDEFHRI